MGVPHALGGLNWGRGTVSVSLTILIVGFVAYLSVTRLDVSREPALRVAADGAADPGGYHPQS
jgi:hypothetical protein